MSTLALDIATKTGWALRCDDGVLLSGVQDFSLQRGESPGMRFVRFRSWLRDMLLKNQVYVVVYEQAHHRGGHATEVCVGLITHMQGVCAEFGAEYTHCHTATLKKFATGKGNAGKPEMLAAAREKYAKTGEIIEDDNQADALMLLAWAEETGVV